MNLFGGREGGEGGREGRMEGGEGGMTVIQSNDTTIFK